MVWMSLDFHQLGLTDGWIITCRYNPNNTSHPPDWEVWGVAVRSSVFVFTAHPVLPLRTAYRRESVLCCVLTPEVKEWEMSARHRPADTALSPLFHLQVTASGWVYSVLPFCFINLAFLLLNCAVSVFCEATGSCSVLKVEIAYPVDDVEQQEGGGEEDTRVCVQFK